MLTTAKDYGRFLAHVLTIDDVRWEPEWRIDDELAWGAGWGLETTVPVFGWRWGLDLDAGELRHRVPGDG